MSITPAELERRSQVEEVWASRLAYADALNEARLRTWQAKHCLILERDLPPTHTRKVKPQSAVSPFRRKANA
jgi:hypothetical protein